MITDCHTHHGDNPDAILSVSPDKFNPLPGRMYSVGIHPWHTEEGAASLLPLLEEAAGNPQVAFIGETGIDRLRGADEYCQKKVFEAHVAISERLRKPLVLHVVKALDAVLKARQKATMPWIWHGFRGNRQVAEQLALKGIYVSFGERFNAEAARWLPQEMLLVETDESRLAIGEIAARVASVREESAQDILSCCAANIQAILAKQHLMP